jgi:hypothetical protein
MACAICQVRRERRFCPGVRGDICTICCGTEREVSVDCPLDCPYLEGAYRHERRPPLDSDEMPNRDIRVSDEFLVSNQELCMFLGGVLGRSALETPGVVDSDAREAIDALIQTYRTLGSGLYYEHVPANPLAAKIFREAQEAVTEFRREEPQRTGRSHTRDADVLGLLVFFQRVGIDRDNGRKRGRAFIAALGQFHAEVSATEAAPASSPLILP